MKTVSAADQHASDLIKLESHIADLQALLVREDAIKTPDWADCGSMTHVNGRLSDITDRLTGRVGGTIAAQFALRLSDENGASVRAIEDLAAAKATDVADSERESDYFFEDGSVCRFYDGRGLYSPREMIVVRGPLTPGDIQEVAVRNALRGHVT